MLEKEAAERVGAAGRYSRLLGPDDEAEVREDGRPLADANRPLVDRWQRGAPANRGGPFGPVAPNWLRLHRTDAGWPWQLPRRLVNEEVLSGGLTGSLVVRTDPRREWRSGKKLAAMRFGIRQLHPTESVVDEHITRTLID